jgi:glycosyltransferase involved in cell wall biosynthesis
VLKIFLPRKAEKPILALPQLSVGECRRREVRIGMLQAEADLASPQLELSIVMPCLDEARTVGTCVRKALAYLDLHEIKGEVIVADNGSTDGSPLIAANIGARVVRVASRGYGNALRAGIAAARGKFVIMGDSDDSYDFSALQPFLDKLRAGFHLVLGNRFKGGIEPRAMPALHKFFGNPLLTLIGRALYKSPSRDFYCGLRGFHREAILALDLDAVGMEFAVEMIVKASIHRLKITEVPTRLSVDGRARPSHLRSWRDGWRTLRLFLLLSPKGLFLYPGGTLLLMGVAGTIILFIGDVAFGGLVFAERTMVLIAAAINIGFQSMLFWVFAQTIAIQRGLLLRDVSFERFRRAMPLERGLALGAALILLGMLAFVAAMFQWSAVGFGQLTQGLATRLVVVSGAMLVLGTQILYGSFFLYLLEYRAISPQREPATRATLTSPVNPPVFDEYKHS